MVTGSYAGCFVCLPENSTWTTGLSNTNGWADMFDAYSGAGNPNNADNGCAFGTVMSGRVAHLLVYLVKNHHQMVIIKFWFDLN